VTPFRDDDVSLPLDTSLPLDVAPTTSTTG
jgi:hypothetical protein